MTLQENVNLQVYLESSLMTLYYVQKTFQINWTFFKWFSSIRAVKGLHLNFAPPAKFGFPMILSLMLGWRFPKLFGFSNHDVKRLYPSMEKMVVEPVKETGYMHIQATKPDTVGERRSYKMRKQGGPRFYFFIFFQIWRFYVFVLQDGQWMIHLLV